MRQIVQTSEDTLCATCVHRDSMNDPNSFLCKLLDLTLILGEQVCDDWEASKQDEPSSYECD